ncbi:unnamed protein product [Caenorhabditis auriculariae]|uniref:Uncharacterized protein n=1 Tax=Caenorhabditis auriculariae TaxID=2777116 RepID=A0A8S1GZT9_9PELO|nr:unnamed protein product [Caenorhabditis auriculariae]
MQRDQLTQRRIFDERKPTSLSEDGKRSSTTTNPTNVRTYRRLDPSHRTTSGVPPSLAMAFVDYRKAVDSAEINAVLNLARNSRSIFTLH